MQLALDLVDHLVLHLLDRCAGPQHLHHHHAEGEVGVLLLTDAEKRVGSSRKQQHEQERGKAAMSNRPGRQVEAFRCFRSGLIGGHDNIAPTR